MKLNNSLNMSEKDNKVHPKLTTVFCIVLLSWLILVPIVNLLQLPLGEDKTGIISLAIVQQISPYTDYLKFAILLFTPALVAAIALKVKSNGIERVLKSILTFISNKNFIYFITIFLLLSWSLDRIFPNYPIGFFDEFHEGEYLGYLPSFTQLKKPFLQSFFIHGFGLDVLPSLLAYWWNTDSIRGISLTRFIYHSMSLLSTFCCFWILWELNKIVKIKPIRVSFLVTVILFCWFEQWLFWVDGGRSLIFMIQFALMLHFFRLNLDINLKNKANLSIPISIGFLIPINFLHTYDRAAYFLLVYLFASALSFSLGKAFSKLWIGGSLLGLTISSLLTIAFLGIDQVSEMASQVLYWSKYSRYMFYKPMPDIKIDWLSQFFWLSILVQSLLFVYLTLDFAQERSIGKFVRRHFILLILLFSSLVYMRIGLDRSEPLMAAQSALMTAFLSSYICLKLYKKYWENRFSRWMQISTYRTLLIFVLLFIILAEPGFGLEKTFYRFKSFNLPDSSIVDPDYMEAVQALKPVIDRQSCFFTATAEGVWYYLFDKPSCSKFGNVYYAQPTLAQEEVTRDLENRKPEIVLLADYPIITERVLADSLPIIFQYFLEKYRPYRLVGSHWFWKRKDHGPSRIQEPTQHTGSLDRFCFAPEDCKAMPEPGNRQTLRRGEHRHLLGSAPLPEQNKPADAVYLSYGQQNQLVAAHRVNFDSTWGITIPTMALPLGKEILKVWAYDASKDEWLQVGYDIEIKVVDESP